MKLNNEELEKLVVAKGLYDDAGNKRIYDKFFANRLKEEEYIYRKFKINDGMKILDIGCSYGQDLINFAQGSLGLEVEPHKVDFARALGLEAIAGNAEQDLAKINRQFDMIWCTDFLVHMVSPYKFLYDCRRLLIPGGKLIIQIPLMSVFNKHRSNCHFYAFNKKSLEYLLEMAGYRVIKSSGLIRKRSKWFNFIFEPVLQIWGGNIWLAAEKEEKAPLEFNKIHLPDWFKF